jgi:N6-L-threonylcarbamoyladenine synthase
MFYETKFYYYYFFKKIFKYSLFIFAMRVQNDWINTVIADAVSNAGIGFEDLAAVAVTVGPGLGMCLKTGIDRATYISHHFKYYTHDFNVVLLTTKYLSVPFIRVNHLDAHALTGRMSHPFVKFPFVAVLVSGGHTQFLLCKGFFFFINREF